MTTDDPPRHGESPEHALRPSLVTSLFPGLPRRCRPTFRAGLIAVVVLLVAFVLLRWQPPLIGISALGLPLLFVGYLRETGFADLSRPALAAAGSLGIGIGTAWAMATDAIWAHTYDDVLATPMTAAEVVINLVVVPIGGVLVMIAPVVAVRLWRPGIRDSLHGFAIGGFTASCFTAAGVLTRAAPEFANGLVTTDYPTDALVTLAAIRGLAAPITAVAIGGLVGVALWSRQRPRHWYSPTSPVPAVGIAVLAYAGQNAVDFAWISYAEIVGLYVAIAVLALLALRITLRAKLLSERNGGADPSGPTPVRHTSTKRFALVLGSALAVVVATTIVLSLWLTPPPANDTCPPDCGRPPLGQPVTINPRFTSDDGAFSVSYPGPGTAYDATIEPNGVVVELRAGDGGSLQLFGVPARNRTPRQIVEELLAETAPDAVIDYEIPNAFVGYQLGYGVVSDVFKAGAAGHSERTRLMVMAAVKNDYALVAAASGPYREFSPDFGSGHPSGANFFLALDMAKYVNSFTWRGDPPR